MDLIKNLLARAPKTGTLILSSLLLVAVIIFALFFLAAHLRDDVVVEVSGRADLDFRVFYLENEYFADGPIPHRLHFLMSFTDYIEVDSRFAVHVDEETEIIYNYNAVLRFLVRYMGAFDGVSNPVVFEYTIPLSSAHGSIFGDVISFPAMGGNGPGGTYTIPPKDFTDFYLDFVATQRHLMYQENVIAVGLRGFSAELLIDFTYTITLPEWGISETAMAGYRMSLSTEVFTLAATGNSTATFNHSIALNDPPPQITLPMVMIFVAAAALSVYGIIRGIGNIYADPNENRREALAILKKYSNEIVVSDAAPQLSQYQSMQVNDFRDLLKLAINLSKHIMCYHDDSMAEFAVIVEGSAYCYRINYGSTDNTTADSTNNIDDGTEEDATADDIAAVDESRGD